MEKEQANLNEEKLKKLFSLIDPKILDGFSDFDPEDFKNKLEKASKAWVGWEEIKNHMELFNWAIRTRFETLSTVSALAATLLIIATFNERLIVLDNYVRVLLSVLLLIIPGSLWGLYYETNKAAGESLTLTYKAAEKYIGEDAAIKLKTSVQKSKTFRGVVPFIIYSAFTIVIFIIFWLIWR